MFKNFNTWLKGRTKKDTKERHRMNSVNALSPYQHSSSETLPDNANKDEEGLEGWKKR